MDDYGFWRVVLGVIGVLLIPLAGVLARVSVRTGRTEQTVETHDKQIEKLDGECGVCRREVHGRIDALVGEVGKVNTGLAGLSAKLETWMRQNGKHRK